MQVRKSWNNKAWLKLGNGHTAFPAQLALCLFHRFGIVQVGSGETYTEPKELTVGESVAWQWGDYKVTIERTGNDGTMAQKVIPFRELVAAKKK
jgi:hypothetical protein